MAGPVLSQCSITTYVRSSRCWRRTAWPAMLFSQPTALPRPWSPPRSTCPATPTASSGSSSAAWNPMASLSNAARRRLTRWCLLRTASQWTGWRSARAATRVSRCPSGGGGGGVAGEPRPGGRVGRLQVRGSSVLRGYLGQADGATCGAGWYDTGDIGFLADAEIYISGRTKDLITRAGLNISPHHAEQVIEGELALRPGSVAVFSVLDMRLAKERVHALIASRGSDDVQAHRLRIARAVVDETGLQLDVIEFVASAELPKTTSGKIQRSAL